jgi:hypothetical protein
MAMMIDEQIVCNAEQHRARIRETGACHMNGIGAGVIFLNRIGCSRAV